MVVTVNVIVVAAAAEAAVVIVVVVDDGVFPAALCRSLHCAP